ncbi:IS30 family transposase [Brevibacterium sp. 50QC2O2]|nr:IS30 family transposase [Brevibacterium sp. 50QC2O2]MCQ9389959.1 IS30 family transposase [Brevibacterium sp. 50QC2O2]
MTTTTGRTGGVQRVDLTDPQPAAGRSYHRLTLAERTFIETALNAEVPWSLRKIARHLGVSPSTVSREVRRHSVDRPGQPRWHTQGPARLYHAMMGHYATMRYRHAARGGKLDDPLIRHLVVERLNARYSPQQVAGRLRVEFPDCPEVWVSHETIYQALYVQGKGSLRHELSVVKALRSGRTGRVPQSKLPRRSSRPWLAGARLSDRPAEVADRAVPGHWEGDLVVGPDSSGLVTLVERQTRFALIGRLPGSRESATVIDVMRGLIEGLPEALRQTITWDQGQEMAQHADFTVATGCRLFFCDPHSPWQRGSNENLNGLIRDFYPKGTNFNRVTDQEVLQMQDLLNDRPRRTLEFRTPRERLDELISGVALAP